VKQFLGIIFLKGKCMQKRIFLLIVFVFKLTIYSANYDTKIELTPTEIGFIKKHPQITLAGGYSFEPYLIQENDKKITGYDVDIIKLINERTGLNIKVELGKWSEIQEKAKKRLYDGLSTSGTGGDRALYYNYSVPYSKYTPLVIVNKGNPKNIYKVKDIQGKKVAVQKGNIVFENLLKSFKNIEIVYYDRMHDLIRAVVSKEVDFTVIDETAFYLANEVGLGGLIEYSFAIGKTNDVVFSLRNDWPELVSIVNKALNSITVKEKLKIKNYWFGNQEKIDSSSEFAFTKEEKEYLKSKKEIKMCMDPDWLPFTKFENGIHTGISADIYKLISQKIPIPISEVQTKHWAQSLEFGKARKCDIFDFAIETPERKKYLNFTSTFLKVPLIIVTKLDVPFIYNFQSIENEAIAIPKGYAFIELLKNKYPLKIIEVDSIGDGLQRVKNGEVFGYIGTLASVAHVFKRDFTGELKVTGRFDESFDMGSAVRNDDEMLLQILQKIISSIPKEQINSIIDKWINIKYEKEFDYTLFWQVVSFILLILFFVLYRHYILNKKVKEEIEKSRKKDNLIFQQNKMASLGQMIETIAHQWRQPLSELTMSQNMILRKVTTSGDISKAELEVILNDEQKIVQFMSSTINIFQDFYKEDLKVEKFKITDAYKDVRILLSETISLNSIKLIESIDEDIEYIGYKNHISQVLLSILQNSIYFLKLRDIENAEVHVSMHGTNNYIEIEIEDNAGGIDEDIIDYIFDYNFSSRDEEEKSTGLGLYISKLIIEEKFQGKIEVFNTKGGVRFLISLPKYNQF